MATDLSLVSAEARPGLVRLTWFAADAAGRSFAVERRSPDSAWLELGAPRVEANGRLSFVDTQVTGGQRYGYRVMERTNRRAFDEIWIDVPATAPALALIGSWPNPARDRLAAAFALPDAAPATLELIDLSGRRLWAREVGLLGTGAHVLPLRETGALARGVYLLRLTRGPEWVSRKVALTR